MNKEMLQKKYLLTERDKLIQKMYIMRNKIKEDRKLNSKNTAIVFKVSAKEEMLLRKLALKKNKNLSTFIRETLFKILK